MFVLVWVCVCMGAHIIDSTVLVSVCSAWFISVQSASLVAYRKLCFSVSMSITIQRQKRLRKFDVFFCSLMRH